MTTIEMQEHLRNLEAERAAAGLAGLTHNARYMDDLRHEVAATRAAYVGSVVTEIAVLRAMLNGRLQG
jgi:hypothetical protein